METPMATPRTPWLTRARRLTLAVSLGPAAFAAPALAQGTVRHTVAARVAPIASVRSASVAPAQADSQQVVSVVTTANATHELQVRFDRTTLPPAVRVQGGEWKLIEPDTWITLATRPHGKHTVVVEFRAASAAVPTPAWCAVTR